MRNHRRWKKGFIEAYAFLSFVVTCATFLNEPKLCSVVFCFLPLQWSPLILNPSYTILHFLGATKVVSQHGALLSLTYFFLSGCGSMLSHITPFPACHFETCICCFKVAEVHSGLLSVETFPITLSSPGRKLLGSLVAKMEGCLLAK